MNKGSPYNSILSHQKRPVARSTVHIGTHFKSPKELKAPSPSKNFGKFKRRLFLSPSLVSPDSKQKSELYSPPKHYKSRSVAHLDSIKFTEPLKSNANSRSPTDRSLKDRMAEAEHSHKSDLLCKELLYKLKLISPIDVIRRAYESIEALKILGRSYTEFWGILGVVTKELEEVTSSRQTLEKKLEHLSRENYSLSKQLELHDTDAKLMLDPAYNSLMSDNKILKAKVKYLETQLRETSSKLHSTEKSCGERLSLTDSGIEPTGPGDEALR